jgi:hypothetical protein
MVRPLIGGAESLADVVNALPAWSPSSVAMPKPGVLLTDDRQVLAEHRWDRDRCLSLSSVSPRAASS